MHEQKSLALSSEAPCKTEHTLSAQRWQGPRRSRVRMLVLVRDICREFSRPDLTLLRGGDRIVN